MSDEPYLGRKGVDANSFYSNPVTQNTTLLREVEPSHYVMNLTTYTWKDIENYIKNPKHAHRPPTSGIRPKF